MKVGDLVKITQHGLSQLDLVSKLPGLVVSVPEKMRLGMATIVYVSWPDRGKPQPMNVLWLEVVNEN
jgi:hypothetical protein